MYLEAFSLDVCSEMGFTLAGLHFYTLCHHRDVLNSMFDLCVDGAGHFLWSIVLRQVNHGRFSKVSSLAVTELNLPLEVWTALWKRLYHEGEITKSNASSTMPPRSMVSGEWDLWLSLHHCEDFGSPEWCQVCVSSSSCHEVENGDCFWHL